MSEITEIPVGVTTSMADEGTFITSPPGNGAIFAGNGVAGSTVHDPTSGVYCHQCRQKTMKTAAACQNQLTRKPCMIKLCGKCLFNRYGEKVEEVACCIKWVCPKCRDICNCSVCMKRKGYQPTGKFINEAKANGFGSVSKMLLMSTCINESLEKELVSYPKKRKEEKSSDRILVTHLPKSTRKKSKNDKGMLEDKDVDKDVDNTTSNICNKVLNGIQLHQDMPKGTDVNNVASEDVRDALLFLDFCSIFGKTSDF